MPRPRNPDNLARQVMPLLLFGVAMTSSSRYFTLIENEALTIGAAAQPLGSVLYSYWTGAGDPHHPPLFDILMQLWMHTTGGTFDYLRIPAILFFVTGILFMSLVARRVVSLRSGLGVLWVGILWPFGFLHGRLALSSTLAFFLVSALTLAYFHYLDEQSFNRWALLFVCAVALVWTSYWGWAVIGFLAVDQYLRRTKAESKPDATILVRTGALLAVSFIPLVRAFWRVFRSGLVVHRPPMMMLSNVLLSFYTFFVGEAVPPWHWQTSVPAAVAIVAALVTVGMVIRGPMRRLFLYGGSLLFLIAVFGRLGTEQLPLAAPWILLPIGVAIWAEKPNWAQIALPASLVAFAGIGWMGVYSLHNYADPQFLDPWPMTAQDIADKVRTGATVISNSPSFFLYLSYAMQNPTPDAVQKLDGVYPDQLHDPRVQSPEQWLAASHPLGSKMIWVQGAAESQPEKPIDDASHELDRDCGSRTSRLSTRDAGYEWKKKYLPGPGDVEWRIEVREYDCGANSGQIIFTIPLR
jgi:hypothetical protein